MSFEGSAKKPSFLSQTAGVLQSIRAGTMMAMLLAFMAVCVSHPSLAETVTVSTLAGNDKLGFADGQGSAAQFDLPSGITIDTVGNLYVADMVKHRIRKVTPKGEVTTLAGGQWGFADGQGSAAKFSDPHGITIDAMGNLYVADRGNHRIRKVTPKGEVSTLAGSDKGGFADGQGSTAQFYVPSGIAIDAAGNLYVADSGNRRIRKITPSGEVTTLAGSEKGFADGKGTAQFDRHGIAIDAAGNLYMTDRDRNLIRKVSPKGEVSTFAGGGKEGFAGFADGQGGAAQFYSPDSIALDAAGNLYVTDKINYRIRKITPKGEVSTLAGNGKRGFADGDERIAQFSAASGIAIDATGNLYVADFSRIRKIVIQRP